MRNRCGVTGSTKGAAFAGPTALDGGERHVVYATDPPAGVVVLVHAAGK